MKQRRLACLRLFFSLSSARYNVSNPLSDCAQSSIQSQSDRPSVVKSLARKAVDRRPYRPPMNSRVARSIRGVRPEPFWTMRFSDAGLGTFQLRNAGLNWSRKF